MFLVVCEREVHLNKIACVAQSQTNMFSLEVYQFIWASVVQGVRDERGCVFNCTALLHLFKNKVSFHNDLTDS